MLNELKITDGFWYLASVYTLHEKGIHDAARIASKVAGRLAKLGVPVFSPIAHSHLLALAAGIDPLDHDFWMATDRPLMRPAHGLLVTTMDGWTKSRGITEEIAEFAKARKPMFTVDPLTLAVDPLE